MKESAIYQEWRQENLAEGLMEERLEILQRRHFVNARKMLQEGMSPEIIAKITELSFTGGASEAIAQIQKLQKQP